MTEEAIIRKRERDRARYLRQREERLVRQREYYREHRDEILVKKRRKAIEKPCVAIKSKSRAEIYHSWYLRNREARIAKVIERCNLLRESKCMAVM